MVDLRHSDELLDVTQDSEAATKKHALLVRRAKLGVISSPVTVEVPYDEQPTRTHPPRRIGVWAGYDEQDGPELGLDMRMAYHDLNDRPTGYPEFAQVQFLHTRLVLPLDPVSAPYVRRMAFLDLAIINPWTQHHKGISWLAEAGYERLDDQRCRRVVVER